MSAPGAALARPRARSISPEDLAFRLRNSPVHLAVIVICLVWTLPTVGLLVSSFRPQNLVATTGWWTAFVPPFQFTLDNYRQVLTTNNMGQSFVNSLFVSIPATVMPILIAAYAAYAFAWMRFPGRDWLFLVVVGLLVVPLRAPRPGRPSGRRTGSPCRSPSRPRRLRRSRPRCSTVRC